MSLHPAARLTLWAAAVFLTQLFSALILAGLTTLCLAAGTAIAPRRLARLLRRTRWLLLAMFVVFAWGTPGHLLLPSLDWASPTQEGLILGLEHGARLLCLVALLALLLELTPPAQLVSGLYSLLLPLRALGLDRRRASVRLLLVLRYLEQEVPARTWREWLRAEPPAQDREPLAVELPPWRWRDAGAVILALAATAWIALP